MIEMNTREQELAYLIVKNSSVTWYYLGRVKVGEGTVLILQFEKNRMKKNSCILLVDDDEMVNCLNTIRKLQ
jgi:hypothetical protein